MLVEISVMLTVMRSNTFRWPPSATDCAELGEISEWGVHETAVIVIMKFNAARRRVRAEPGVIHQGSR